MNPPTRRRLLAALVAAVSVTAAGAAYAQRIWVGGPGGGRFFHEPPKWAKAANFDGQFNTDIADT